MPVKSGGTFPVAVDLCEEARISPVLDVPYEPSIRALSKAQRGGDRRGAGTATRGCRDHQAHHSVIGTILPSI
jgi:hypothetical protein